MTIVEAFDEAVKVLEDSIIGIAHVAAGIRKFRHPIGSEIGSIVEQIDSKISRLKELKRIYAEKEQDLKDKENNKKFV